MSSLAAVWADRFRVERELGRGGMATVYLARDLKHDRLVALKVLRRELAAAIGVERFLREIQIAARLSHPHIVPLHDSGAVDDLPYYVMPYIDGESLRARLLRDGQLSVADAVRLAREVAGALAYAHSHDVVHRDIKPENILLQDGHALVTDFGIARAINVAGGPGLTHTGVTVGTPLYMSPEQIAGDPVDGRSDVYSLGCVLYEMLAGSPPFGGSTSLAVLASHSVEPIPSLRTRDGSAPEPLARAVARSLAKTPAQRYGKAAELDAALAALVPATVATTLTRSRLVRRIAITAIVAGFGIAGLTLATRRHDAAAQSIAVLPLVNESGTQDDEIRADGMTDALIDGLSHVTGLNVASRMSVFAYRDAHLDSRAIGARLHVATMLEGSYQHAGPTLQVSVRLVSAGDGYVRWSDTFRRDRKDVFALQDEISQAVVRALQVRLVGDARPLVRRATENLEAYDLYMKGRWFWNQRGSGPAPLHRAVDYFNQAIALDSSYARAWAGLADAYSLLPAFGDVPPADAFAKAKRAVQRALALDSTLAEAYTSLGIVSVFYDWDWSTAARAFDRALALDATEPRAHLFHAWYYVAQGQLDDALREVETARQLNPLSPIINTRLGSVLYYLHRYDAAAAALREALALDSTNLGARAELGRLLIFQHHIPEGLATLPRKIDLQAGHNGGGFLGWAYGVTGRRADALAIQRSLEQLARERYITPQAFTLIALGVGDTARALDWLERAYSERGFYLPMIGADPQYEPIRGSPRFQRIVRAIGLQVVPSDVH
ncbi:MAG TPA: protein kinase [Gemmatimonadales bacterium]|nr:protein kinase [Gemmatimonadales bacterium]